MFSTMKLYMYGAFAVIASVFYAVFKYRGNKIDNLEKELEVAEVKAEVVGKVIKAERKVLDFETTNKVAAAKASGPDTRTLEDVNEHFYSI